MSGNIAEINRKLSVFLYCHVFRPDFEVYLGVIGPAELNGAIRFKSHLRTWVDLKTDDVIRLSVAEYPIFDSQISIFPSKSIKTDNFRFLPEVRRWV